MGKQGGGFPTDVDDDHLSSRVEELIRRGLDRYNEGDLVGALSEWEHAVTLEPEADRAQKYIDYVRDNFEQLEAQFEKMREAAAMGVPLGANLDGDDDGDDDDGDYAAFEVEDPAAQLTKWIEDVDDGWEVDEPAAEPLPPAPESHEPAEVVTAEMARSIADETDFSDLNMVLDEHTEPPQRSAGEGSAEMPAIEIEADEPPMPPDAPDAPEAPEAQPTVEYGDDNYPVGEWIDLTGSGDYPAAQSGAGADPDDDELTVPGGDEPPPLAERPSLSQDAIAAIDAPRDSAEPPGEQVPSEFDLGEVGRLDSDMRDDRVAEGDGGVQVTFHEVGTSEKTIPARPIPTVGEPLQLDLGEGDDLLDLDRGDTESDEEQTAERRGNAGLWPRAFDRPPTEDPALRNESVIVEDGLRAASDLDATREVPAVGDEEPTDAVRTLDITERAGLEAARMEVAAAQLNDEIDEGAPSGESDDERTRRRVTALIERARTSFGTGQTSAAVVAVDLALDEKPDSAIAQKIVHQHRDLLFEVFEAYVGSHDAMPKVVMPPHEIAVQELDSRAAFLLSRIDGTMTIEEILDVSGMARLEAYRHLCRLLLRGILQVR